MARVVLLVSAGNAIVYALVARETVILAEFAAGTGNFASITRKILEKIPSTDSRMSYVCDRHIFHIMVFDGLTYMCMAEEDFGRCAPAYPPCIPCIPPALPRPARVHGQRAVWGKGATFAMSLPCGCISTARTPVRRTQAGRAHASWARVWHAFVASQKNRACTHQARARTRSTRLIAARGTHWAFTLVGARSHTASLC